MSMDDVCRTLFLKDLYLGFSNKTTSLNFFCRVMLSDTVGSAGAGETWEISMLLLRRLPCCVWADVCSAGAGVKTWENSMILLRRLPCCVFAFAMV